MEDAVRASREDTRRTLARSRHTWSSYLKEANSEIGLPLQCVQLRNILSRVPSFPANQVIDGDDEPTQLKLEHRELRGNGFELFTSGRSTWHTSEGYCDLGVKTLRYHLLLGIQRSTPCYFAEDSRFANWPGIQSDRESAMKGNYLAILVFAWAYILSAQWVEMQQSKNSETDFPKSADHDVEVDLGDVGDDAARWWAAILATGEGWRATISRNSIIYRSLWSICVAAAQRFKLRRTASSQMPNNDIATLPPLDVLPSSEVALGFLSDFCVVHDIYDQCSPALAAALLFPCLRGMTATLPFPKPRRSSTLAFPSTPIYPIPSTTSPSSYSSQLEMVLEARKLIPYYMTLSCNPWGMRALLYSAFFDSEVCCNLVSPWLEPVFNIIDPIVKHHDYETLAIVMGKRQPKLAALWLGAIITGMEKHILQAVRTGLSVVELHAAAWTTTIHSFICLGSSTPCDINGIEIRRSDECRLLYLTECEGYSRVPICPWKPFGTIPLCDTEIDIRQHAQCEGHCLRYISWSWDLIDGISSGDKGYVVNSECTEADQATRDTADLVPLEIPEDGTPKSELLSEVATRGIFGWLRWTRYPSTEKNIRTHSWIDLEDSDDGSVGSASSSGDKSQGTIEARVEGWLKILRYP